MCAEMATYGAPRKCFLRIFRQFQTVQVERPYFRRDSLHRFASRLFPTETKRDAFDFASEEEEVQSDAGKLATYAKAVEVYDLTHLAHCKTGVFSRPAWGIFAEQTRVISSRVPKRQRLSANRHLGSYDPGRVVALTGSYYEDPESGRTRLHPVVGLSHDDCLPAFVELAAG